MKKNSTNLNFYINMARGYREMGNINLQMAEEHIHLGIEGVNDVYEMDFKEIESAYQSK